MATKTKNVKTSIGEFTVGKPKAGVRNDGYVYAERNNGSISRIKLFTYLIPKCIVKRPENIQSNIPISQVLDSMEPEEYDKLLDAVEELLFEHAIKAEKEEENQKN